MKKVFLFALVLSISVLFTACGGVSQEDYNNLQENLAKANERIEAFSEMEQKYAGLSASEIEEQTAVNELKAEQNRIEKERIAAEERAKAEEARIEAEKGKVDKAASMLSDDGVYIRDIAFFLTRNIVTVNMENTTNSAKTGYVDVSCLDKDGLQLKELNIKFTIPAQSKGTFQNKADAEHNSTPEGTVLVKATGILAVDN